MLESIEKNINDYQIVPYEINLSKDEKSMKEINEELTIIVSEQDLLATWTLNEQQKYAYDMILQKVFSNEGAAFFLLMVPVEQEKHFYIELYLPLLDLKT